MTARREPDLAVGVDPPSPHPPGRRRAARRSARRDRLVSQLPLVAVFAVAVVGLVAVWLHHWRKGLYVLGLAVVLAALLRLVLPERRAGLLAVRRRWIDVALLAAVGVAVVVLATVIPPVSVGPTG